MDVLVDTFLRKLLLWKLKVAVRKTHQLRAAFKIPAFLTLLLMSLGFFNTDIDSVNSDFNQAACGRKVRSE